MRGSIKKSWPVLKRYDQDHLSQVALPLGGIGTGTVSLGGRGELRDWEVMNRPAKGYSAGPTGNGAPFFALYTKQSGQAPQTRALMGPLEPHEYQHMEGRPVDNHGLPRFQHARFEAAYPLGQVHLADPCLPVKVRLKAFNPLIPGDAEASGLPLAVLTYELENLSRVPLAASVCGVLRNFVGEDGFHESRDWKGEYVPSGAKDNRNRARRQGKLQGVFMDSMGVDLKSESWGSLALSTLSPGKIRTRLSAMKNNWGGALLDFWDDFSADGELDASKGEFPLAALAVKIRLAPRATGRVTFLLTWHFPNRYAWSESRVGNYYTARYRDAWDVALKESPRLAALEKGTVDFVSAFCGCDLPVEIKEAALFNLSTLRSQTVFRLPEGTMMGWEGSMDHVGSCHGSCTHVWNYDQATPFLFGFLAQGMRRVEFAYATDKSGLMSFRANLPLKSRGTSHGKAAADGQMGCLMKLYREWQLSGDLGFLKSLYPQAKRCLQFCWIKGGWDADQDGVMEGCQHNTMDVEYYGPNPQMQIWYLGALRAMEEMARGMGDRAFQERCRSLFERGSAWTDKHLFNGEYYEQIIRKAASVKDSPEGLRAWEPLPKGAPRYQLGRGCLVDQLVGQAMAHVCGLGYLVKPGHARRALKSILKYNRKGTLADHFNPMRSYALGEERGLLMASFPKGRPKIPFPYYAEIMTGFEYTAAYGMIYEGMRREALECIRDIRQRYDGRKRSPFDEAECGHHYARAMASWGAVLAWTGFGYSSVKKELRVQGLGGRYFWSTGQAYGLVNQRRVGAKWQVGLEIREGCLKLNSLVVQGRGKKVFKQALCLTAGQKALVVLG